MQLAISKYRVVTDTVTLLYRLGFRQGQVGMQAAV